MTDLVALKAANTKRWQLMKIHPELIPAIDKIAARLIAPLAKAQYMYVSEITGVPWFIIAVIHEREASQSWNANLAQGDPWNKVSTHVPRGQGPFTSWKAAAVNALEKSPPYASHNQDWSAGGSLTCLEEFNGVGYANRGLPSPYIWASTDQYEKGKYIADGHFDPDAIDHQIGCAALIFRMAATDKDVAFK